MGRRGPKRRDNRPTIGWDCCRLDVVELLSDKGLLAGEIIPVEWIRHGRLIGAVDVALDENLPSERMRICYRVSMPDGTSRDVIDHVEFTTTPCNFGGARSWFACPGCGGRARYLAGGSPFLCQRCFPVRYPSQDLSKTHNRLRKVRRLLHSEPGEPIEKIRPPRWMRANRVKALILELIRLEELRTREVMAMTAGLD